MEGLKRAEDLFEELYREKPGFQEAWDEVEPEYQLATQIIGLRKKLNITQLCMVNSAGAWVGISLSQEG